MIEVVRSVFSAEHLWWKIGWLFILLAALDVISVSSGHGSYIAKIVAGDVYTPPSN